ncbi:MAG: DNA polymerase III subunit delta [Bacteroidota bacterium]
MAKTKEKFDVEPFIASFKKGQFAPMYFFCGEETFLIDEVVEALIKYAVDPSMKEFNFDLIHGSEIDGKKIVSLASSYPMMAERRVVIIKDFDKVKEKDALEAYAEQPSATTTLVMVAHSADLRKKPYNTFKKLGIIHEASLLRDYEINAWIESRLKRMKRSMEPAAVQLLANYVGSSMRELTNEIEKVLLTIPEGAAITAKDVERVVGVSREFTPFELSNKIAEKKTAKAMEIADRLIGSGESPVGLIAVLTLHFIKLWKIQDAVRQKKSEQEMLQFTYRNSYALKESLEQVRNFRPAEIENVFVLLAEADLSAKSGGDAKLIMSRLISEIVSGTVATQEEAVVL